MAVSIEPARRGGGILREKADQLACRCCCAPRLRVASVAKLLGLDLKQLPRPAERAISRERSLEPESITRISSTPCSLR